MAEAKQKSEKLSLMKQNLNRDIWNCISQEQDSWLLLQLVLDWIQHLKVILESIAVLPIDRFPTGTDFEGFRLEDDFRRTLPRFDDEHWTNNKQLVDEFAEFAHSKNSTPAQIALAWVLAQGNDMIPIPGTKQRKYLEENAAAVDITLTEDDLEEIENIVSHHPNVGNRYSEGSMRLVNQ